MINKITIHELSDATRISYKENSCGYNAWITTVDEEDRHKVKRLKNNFSIGNSGFKYFCQFFYDWSDQDYDPFIMQNIETMGPRKSQVQNIITFIKENLIESDVAYNLGVNCFAGISRSTAIGIIAWVLSGKTPEQALEEILKVRPQAWPNLRILRFASEILDVDIMNPVKKWIDSEKKNIYTGGWEV
jgi:hypothetical protein